jgi:hypothetical protein
MKIAKAGFMFFVFIFFFCGQENIFADDIVYPPRIGAPKDGKTVYSRNPVLYWAGGGVENGLQELQLQVSGRSDFGSFIVDQELPLDAREFTLNCYNQGHYYWRIRGKYEGLGWSDWDHTDFWVIFALPSQPVIKKPVAGEKKLFGSYLDVEWEDAGGQIGYVIDVANSSDFSHLIIHTTETYPPSGGAPNNRQQVRIPTGMPSGEYYIRVKLQRESGWGDWCIPQSFYIFRRVHLTDPNDNEIMKRDDVRVRLAWRRLDPPCEYEAQWSKARNFSHAFTQKTNNTELEISDLQNETEYFWRVKESSSPWTGTEESRSFKVSVIPTMPGIIEPAQGARLTTPRPTFRWHSVPYGEYYLLEVLEGSINGSLVFSKRTGSSSGIISVICDRDLPYGIYVVRLRSANVHNELSGPWLSRFEISRLTPQATKPFKIKP